MSELPSPSPLQAGLLPPAKAGNLIPSVTLPAFAAALFVSAALMFAIQPMFTRMVLPVLGGAPAVWSVAMVFFQGLLLLGYLYAHIATRFVPVRFGPLLHLAIMAAAAVCLPVAMASGWGAPPQAGIALWLTGLFTASLGLPFFALAGNGPLLQAWFARSGHPQARDPYFLYGASSLGSFAGLLLYPVLFEPLMTLGGQSRAWTIGFAVLTLLIGGAGALALRACAAAGTERAPLAPALSAGQRLRVVGLAFVPSGLLVATTTQLTTDIVAAPFIWVIPLALYLLTFTLAFREGPLLPHALMLRLQPALLGAAVLLIANAGAHDQLGPMLGAMILTTAAFFVCAMVAHGEIYAHRPPAGQLTEFYLWMSAGGVLGGIFCALIAPQIFSTILEYPVLLVLAVLCRPEFWRGTGQGWAKTALGVTIGAVCLALPGMLGWVQLDQASTTLRFTALVVAVVAIMLAGPSPGRLLGLAAATLIIALSYPAGFGKVQSFRSFFGVHRIVDSSDGRTRLLYHGTTIHGAQFVDVAAAAKPPEMLTYYYEGGPISQAIHAARSVRGGLPDVAVVGLGAGSLACAARPGESWRFFEIDPEVVALAKNPKYFRFLSDCAQGGDVVVGDARLTLAKDQRLYDLIVLDAFSSDAIPVHLLTREAMALYQSRLKPDGMIAIHISNRHMRLDGAVARLAQQAGLQAWLGQDENPGDFLTDFHTKAAVVVIARDAARIGDLQTRSNWVPLAPEPSIVPWSDDYANVLQAIWRNISR